MSGFERRGAHGSVRRDRLQVGLLRGELPADGFLWSLTVGAAAHVLGKGFKRWLESNKVVVWLFSRVWELRDLFGKTGRAFRGGAESGAQTLLLRLNAVLLLQHKHTHTHTNDDVAILSPLAHTHKVQQNGTSLPDKLHLQWPLVCCCAVTALLCLFGGSQASFCYTEPCDVGKHWNIQ